MLIGFTMICNRYLDIYRHFGVEIIDQIPHIWYAFGKELPLVDTYNFLVKKLHNSQKI